MKTRLDKNICPWWDGPCLFEALDATHIPQRDPEGPFRCDSLSMFLFFYPNSLSLSQVLFSPHPACGRVEASSLVNKFDFWYIFQMVCIGLENALLCQLLSCLCVVMFIINCVLRVH